MSQPENHKNFSHYETDGAMVVRTCTYGLNCIIALLPEAQRPKYRSRRNGLKAAGFGNGKHGFSISNVASHIPSGSKYAELRVRNNDAFTTIGVKFLVPASQFGSDEASKISQLRWRGDEEDSGLTWGEMWTGDSFVDTALRFMDFTLSTQIAEIGPGYGRVLDTVLRRSLPF